MARAEVIKVPAIGPAQVRLELLHLDHLEPGDRRLWRRRADRRDLDHLGPGHGDGPPAGVRRSGVPRRVRAARRAPADRDRGGAARRHPFDRLRHVGAVRVRALLRPACSTAADDRRHARLAAGQAHFRDPQRGQHLHRLDHPGHHDPALHGGGVSGPVRRRAAAAARKRLRHRRDAGGGGLEGAAALCPARRHRGGDAEPGTRARRDHGGDLHHRQFAHLAEVPVRLRLDPRLDHRQ